MTGPPSPCLRAYYMDAPSVLYVSHILSALPFLCAAYLEGGWEPALPVVYICFIPISLYVIFVSNNGIKNALKNSYFFKLANYPLRGA